MGHEHVWLASAEIAHDFMAKRANIYSDKHDIPVMSGVKERAQYLPLLGYNGTSLVSSRTVILRLCQRTIDAIENLPSVS